jgi:hypothetical protein
MPRVGERRAGFAGAGEAGEEAMLGGGRCDFDRETARDGRGPGGAVGRAEQQGVDCNPRAGEHG